MSVGGVKPPIYATTRAACISAKFASIHPVSAPTRSAAPRPNAVSEYSTCGGTTGCATRSTKPSPSNACNVCESIRSDTPPTRLRSAENRKVPSCNASITSTPHWLVKCFSTARDGHSAASTFGAKQTSTFTPVNLRAIFTLTHM
ncbi:MAG: hypothetical protein JWS11_1576 [Cypionkella sp.]|nr:hypothetical protein [Cypionkella sp.]